MWFVWIRSVGNLQTISFSIWFHHHFLNQYIGFGEISIDFTEAEISMQILFIDLFVQILWSALLMQVYAQIIIIVTNQHPMKKKRREKETKRWMQISFTVLHLKCVYTNSQFTIYIFVSVWFCVPIYSSVLSKQINKHKYHLNFRTFGVRFCRIYIFFLDSMDYHM